MHLDLLWYITFLLSFLDIGILCTWLLPYVRPAIDRAVFFPAICKKIDSPINPNSVEGGIPPVFSQRGKLSLSGEHRDYCYRL